MVGRGQRFERRDRFLQDRELVLRGDRHDHRQRRLIHAQLAFALLAGDEGELLGHPADLIQYFEVFFVPGLHLGEAVVGTAGGTLRELQRIEHVILALHVKPIDEADQAADVDRGAHLGDRRRGRRWRGVRAARARSVLPGRSRGSRVAVAPFLG